MKIRTKILLGFLILSIMLAVAGAYSIYELNTISTSVQALLDDNYKSINEAKRMIESLEREDSGILLLLSGKWKEGRTTVNDADVKFIDALKEANQNITVEGEKELIESIRNQYEKFRKHWDRPIVDTENEGDLNWYFDKVHQDFAELKTTIEAFMSLNDKAMYKVATMLKNRARRAVMPGIVAITSALLLTVVFIFFINLYIVNPILSTIQSVNRFLQNGEPVKIDVTTRDELYDLANAVQNLTKLVHNGKTT